MNSKKYKVCEVYGLFWTTRTFGVATIKMSQNLDGLIIKCTLKTKKGLMFPNGMLIEKEQLSKCERLKVPKSTVYTYQIKPEICREVKVPDELFFDSNIVYENELQ